MTKSNEPRTEACTDGNCAACRWSSECKCRCHERIPLRARILVRLFPRTFARLRAVYRPGMTEDELFQSAREDAT